MSPERVENLRRLGASWVEDGTHPALVLLVARRGIIVLHEAWGKQTDDRDAPPLLKDAIFPVASLSKVFTSTLAMLLVEEGLLGLNRPVQDYIPEFQGEGKEDVLVHHLLTHTSGLRDEDIVPRLQGAMERLRGAVSQGTLTAQSPADFRHPLGDEAFEALCKAPLSRPPGQEMSYSNQGFGLLGDVVQRVSGESVTELGRRRLFEPVGMADTDFLLPDSKQARLVRHRPSLPMGLLLYAILGRVALPAGSATSTALDLARFGQMFLEGGQGGATRILSPVTIREMTRNQIPGTPAEYEGEYMGEASWGYGWGVKGHEKWLHRNSLMRPETFWHSGGTGSVLWVDPVDQLVCVYCSIITSSRNRFDRDENDDLFANAAVAAIDD
jgi:CubicO group peptidase (beta-lactamase class C family)